MNEASVGETQVERLLQAIVGLEARLVDRAAELERVRAERDRLAVEITCMHEDHRQGITRAIRIMRWGQGPGTGSEIETTLAGHDRQASERQEPHQEPAES